MTTVKTAKYRFKIATKESYLSAGFTFKTTVEADKQPSVKQLAKMFPQADFSKVVLIIKTNNKTK